MKELLLMNFEKILRMELIVIFKVVNLMELNQ